MSNFFTDNDDILYYFDKGIDWEPLFRATERGVQSEEAPATAEEAKQLYRDIAEMVGKFAAEEIAPHADAMEAEGVKLVDGEAVMPDRMNEIFAQLRELDMHWLCIPRELGGMNCPLLLYMLGAEVMGRADVSTMAHHSFHGGIALAMLVFSIREGTTTFEDGRISQTRFAEEIKEIGRGDAWGCMDITEPDAGSDMAALRSYGEQDDDGAWFVTGQKIFITSGHGKYHFVIARTETPQNPDDPFAGLGGLSFFLVKAYDDDADGNRTRYVTIDRLEEKMGHHSSATCALTFERAPAQLIGKRGEGFKYMLTLMNNARVGVGFECIGLCEAAYRKALAYAQERPSMGKTIDRHEMIADYLEQMRTDIQGLRALAVASGYHEELGTKYSLFIEHDETLEEGKRKALQRKSKWHQSQARRLTPLLKYLGAERAVEIARTGVQIHGGNGYITEYGAEKLLRDAMVMPIYEGTSQIQSLMAMKDTLMGIMKQPQQFVRNMAQARWSALSSRDPLERRVAKLQSLSYDVQQLLLRKTVAQKFRKLQDKPITAWGQAFVKDWNPKRDFAFAMLHAERLTQILADVAVAELLLEQAKKHSERADVLQTVPRAGRTAVPVSARPNLDDRGRPTGSTGRRKR